MKKIYYYLIGTLLIFPLCVKNTVGISLQDFRKVIYRPENLPAGSTSNTSVETKVIDLLNSLINLILFASGSVAVLMLVYGGIRLITSVGDQEGKDHAVKIIRFAIIGLLVVILAYALVTNIIDLIYRATT